MDNQKWVCLGKEWIPKVMNSFEFQIVEPLEDTRLYLDSDGSVSAAETKSGFFIFLDGALRRTLGMLSSYDEGIRGIIDDTEVPSDEDLDSIQRGIESLVSTVQKVLDATSVRRD